MKRRDFIKSSLLGLSGLSAGLPSQVQAKILNAAVSAGRFSDNKALVCIFLLGGNDSLNMLVPTEQQAWQEYATTRQNLAIDQQRLLAIDAGSPQYSTLGVPNEMAALHALYQQGHAAFVANVGSLIEPVSKSSIYAGSVQLPPQLFSHSDQQNHWMTGYPQGPALTGWAGRMADLLFESHVDLSMNLSMAGNNLWQTGTQVMPFALGLNGAEELTGINPAHQWQQANSGFFDRISQGAQSTMAREYSDIITRTRQTGLLVNEALSQAPMIQTSFPVSQLANQLYAVTRMISVQSELQQSRQVYYVAMGGWDTHDNQANLHPILLRELSEALAAFYQATNELGIADKVTTFTASDFGRTLTSNGDGTDHGWGGHQIVVGGAVNGGQVFGDVPVMALDSDDDLADGRIIPSHSVEQYVADLARWFGVSNNELNEILPNLSHFDDPAFNLMSAS